MATTLASVRYPLNDDSHRTIKRGLGHLTDSDDSLIVLHVALLQNGEKIGRDTLRMAVEAEFGELPAHYIVRQGYVLEEAIIDEAARQHADRVLVGKTKRGRISRRLGQLFGLYPDLEAELSRNLSTTLEVVE